MITHQVRRLAIIHEWRSLPSWFMWKARQGGMPPPARGCLRSKGPVPGGQAGVAGGTLPCQTQEGGTLACHTKKGAGWHEATCHPRLGGACEARALCREGRRGSPVAPCLATRRKMAPWAAETRKGCDRTGRDRTGQDRTARPGRSGNTQKKEGGSNESPSRKTAATYSPNWCVSTIGVDGLNFSVRNGKRWVPGAIATAI